MEAVEHGHKPLGSCADLREKLERTGCVKPVVGLVVPAGSSFNLDGTTIYLSLATIFLAQVFGVELTAGQMLTVIGVRMVTSKGVVGVAGSGFVVPPSTLTAAKVIPVEGLALLLGVDWFMSEARSITHFIGNGVAIIFLFYNEGALNHAQAALVLSGNPTSTPTKNVLEPATSVPSLSVEAEPEKTSTRK